MFKNSTFNQPLSNWDTSKLLYANDMFRETPFNQPLNDWDTSSLVFAGDMFQSSPFNQPLNKWNTSSLTVTTHMFFDTPFNQNIDSWAMDKNLNARPGFESSSMPLYSVCWDDLPADSLLEGSREYFNTCCVPFADNGRTPEESCPGQSECILDQRRCSEFIGCFPSANVVWELSCEISKDGYFNDTEGCRQECEDAANSRYYVQGLLESRNGCWCLNEIPSGLQDHGNQTQADECDDVHPVGIGFVKRAIL